MKALIIVLLLLVVVAVGFYFAAAGRRRSSRLKARFGPEYDRTVAEVGNTRQAEADLAAREQRRAGYELKSLDRGARERYAAAWTSVQASFVDAPDTAVRDADRLVTTALADRGYPTQDRDRLVGDLSVDLAPEHADVLNRFREAHDVFLRNERKEATTEDLRRAMQHYRTLMEEVVSP